MFEQIPICTTNYFRNPTEGVSLPVLRALMILSLMLAGCTRYAAPQLEVKPGEKTVIGAIQIRGAMQAKDPDTITLPGSLFLYIAPIRTGRDSKGNLVIVKTERAESYVVKSAWQDPALPHALPFFIPLQPGGYIIESAKFQYPQPLTEYILPLSKTGIPFIVSNKADATYVGQLNLKISQVDVRKRSAQSDLWVEEESDTRKMFLNLQPSSTIINYILPIKKTADISATNEK